MAKKEGSRDKVKIIPLEILLKKLHTFQMRTVWRDKRNVKR